MWNEIMLNEVDYPEQYAIYQERINRLCCIFEDQGENTAWKK